MTAFALSRRGALACSGATIFVALTGGMLRAYDAAGRPLPAGDAYAPWRLWDDPSIRGTPLALVAAGVLAANPHDTQPWLFAVSADAIGIFADLSRNLGAMDAYVREMHLGLGCAIENMMLAAGPNGYAAELEARPGSLTALNERQAPVHAASLRLKPRGRRRRTRSMPPSPSATPTATATIAPGPCRTNGAVSRPSSTAATRFACFSSRTARSAVCSTPRSSRPPRRSSPTGS